MKLRNIKVVYVQSATVKHNRHMFCVYCPYSESVPFRYAFEKLHMVERDKEASINDGWSHEAGCWYMASNRELFNA